MADFARTISGRITPADKARSDYFYLSFDLPRPAARLRLRYGYTGAMSSDQVEGGSVVDIGLFDPRGAAFPGGVGFRGWSGSRRDAFEVGVRDATPGYLPGPLPAGEYQVILGLYRIHPEGTTYTIEVEADWDGDDGEPAVDAGSGEVTDHAPAAERIWLRGDLQSHTEHSDAFGTLEQLVAKARALGLDYLAITDHNTTSHHPHLPRLTGDDLLLIAGQESTTYRGHMNIWGTGRWCDFRASDDGAMARIIELAHAHGGLCSINHPKPGGPDWEYDEALPVDAMEVWQGPWPWLNAGTLARWERLLMDGRRLPAVGGSDYHCPSGAETGFLRLGQPTTWVLVEARSMAAILDAIRAGRVSISAAPDGPRLDLRAAVGGRAAGMGETLSVSQDALLAVEVDIERALGWRLRIVSDGVVAAEYPITSMAEMIRHEVAAERYVRAEVIGDCPPALLPPDAPAGLDLRDWRWALSNPIYVDRQF
jgi:hypothetical protein